MIVKFDDFLKQAGGTENDIQVLSPMGQKAVEKKQPSLLSRVGEKVGSKLEEITEGAIKGGFEQTVQGLGEAQTAQNPIQLLEGTTKAGAGIIGTLFAPLAPIFHPIGKAIEAVANKIGGNTKVQDFANSELGQLTTRIVDDINNLNTMAAGVAGAKVSENIKGPDLGAFKERITTKPPGADLVQTALSEGKGLLERSKSYLGSKNVESNLKTSAKRLAEESTDEISRQGIGKTQIESPLNTYNKFAEQEATFKGDIMQDPALGIVGERVGDAYGQVVKLRQNVGATIGEELKTVGKLKTDIAKPQKTFSQELLDQGLTFGEKGLRPTKVSKFTSQDIKMLDTYLKSLNKLGTKPTLAELDAFLSRIANELDVYKSQNNITNVTNAERIIKTNLRNLREGASPSANPAFTNYYNAKSLYSDLSGFLDEGSSFLGKKTQTGDFAKDTSLTKSAVQSILNNGKKDWLMRLEGLTGYPALDEAVLALQAMKDAGNFRGLSLLEIINENKVPLTKWGIAGKAADFVIEGGKRVLLGSEADQTRAFLKSLESKP